MSITKIVDPAKSLRLGPILGPDAMQFMSRSDRAHRDTEAAFNKLPVYVEGTWTPTLGGTTSATGMVYTAVTNGLYTRYGNLITALWDIQLSTLGTITGDAVVEGLPSPAVEDVAMQLGYWDQMSTVILTMPARLVVAESRVRLYRLNVAATASYGTPLVQADFSNTSRLIGSVTYLI